MISKSIYEEESENNDDKFKYERLMINGVLSSYSEDNCGALGCFSEAIRMRPDRFEAYLQRGLCFYNSNLKIDSIRDFDTALSLNNLSPGELHLFQGLKWEIGSHDFEKAEKEYLSALEFDSNSYYGHYFMGFIERERGFLGKSLKMFQKAYEIGSPYNNSLVLYHICRCYIRMIFTSNDLTQEKKKEYELEAEKCLVKSLEINEHCVRSIIEYGDFLCDFKKKIDEGITFYEKVLHMNKRYISAYDRIAEALCLKIDRDENDNNRIKECISKMRELDPTFYSSYCVEAFIISKTSTEGLRTEKSMKILEIGLNKCYTVRSIRSLKRSKRLILDIAIRDNLFDSEEEKMDLKDKILMVDMEIRLGLFDSVYKTRMKNLMKKFSYSRTFTDVCVLIVEEI